jgi:hypothetical protein
MAVKNFSLKVKHKASKFIYRTAESQNSGVNRCSHCKVAAANDATPECITCYEQ